MDQPLRLLSILCLMAAAACAEESVDTSGSAGAAGDGGSAGDAGAGGDAGTGGDAGAAGECGSAGATGGDTCYTPTPLAGIENFLAKDGDNKRTYTFKTPGDPESGPVTVTISGEQITGSVRVQGSEDVVTLLLPVYEPTISKSFAAAPGVTYEIQVQEFSVTGTLGEVEQPVQVSWSLAPLKDCYEPNNTPEQAAPLPLDKTRRRGRGRGRGRAAPLPLDKTLWAFLYAGATADGPTYDDYTDYYAITVDKAGKLRVVYDPPGTRAPVPAKLALFRAGEETELAAVFDFEFGKFSQQVEADVTPGTYLVRISPSFSFPIDSSADKPLAHWSPYTLKATLE
jgi:hypothetical protein